LRSDRGQAAVELLVALPLAAIVALAAWQIVLAGQTWWTVSEASRIAARASYVSTERVGAAGAVRAATMAADAALPAQMRARRTVEVGASGEVTVSAVVPLVRPFASVIGDGAGPRVSASAELGR
jgi:hypothetical protein